VHTEDLQGANAHPAKPSLARGLSGQPVVVGEVLYDVFPDGTRTLGGAPFNVAWHLQAFGLQPLLITRIGEDPEGSEIIDAMTSWGLDPTGVQHDTGRPTGRVRVDVEDGEPSFTILPDQAYDNLDRDAALAVIEGLDISLVYHGTLIARSAASRSTVEAIRGLERIPAFVDVNLRDPWWDSSTVTSLLRGARWVKLNRDELDRLSDPAAVGTDPGVGAAARAVLRQYGVSQLIVTKGAEGASVFEADLLTEGVPPTMQPVVDTVGAGDAFSAVWIAGLYLGWPTETTLKRALGFAAEVCTVRGAITDDRSLYRQQLENWNNP
jgi:fructokinase